MRDMISKLPQSQNHLSNNRLITGTHRLALISAIISEYSVRSSLDIVSPSCLGVNNQVCLGIGTLVTNHHQHIQRS